MKLLLILCLTLFSLSAQNLTLGLGLYSQTQPYKDVDPLLTPSPIIFYDNSLIYVRWTRGGIYFLGDKNKDLSWGFSLTAQPRTYGYKSSDSSYLYGMQEKKNSFEAGLAFTLKKEKLFFDLMLLSDPFYQNKAYLVQSELGYSLSYGDLNLYPGFMLYYHSKNFNNYYYGVQKDEVQAQREIYLPKGGLSYAINSYMSYPITSNLSTFAHIKAHFLSDEAKKSPLVEDETIYSGLISLIYTFHYK